MRTFISINFPEEIIEEIIKIQSALPEFIGKKIEKDNLHLTLKFLGEIDEEKLERVKNKLSRVQLLSFKSELTEIGIFSKEDLRIVWIGVSKCDELQKRIDSSLENLFKKEQRFMSHLTIARVKKVKDKNKFIHELKDISRPKTSFDVKEFYLMKSELTKIGPIYSIIKKYPLRIYP